MVAESALRLLPAIALLLAACASNPRVEKPYFVEPDRRDTAARYLDEALSKSGRGVSEIHADENTLQWHEIHTLTDKRMVMISRQLELRQVRKVVRPEKDDIGWTLRLEASGGNLQFRFRDDVNASKAEAGFRRLMQEK